MSSSIKRRGSVARFFRGLWSLLTWTRIAFFNLLFLLFIVVLVMAFRTGGYTPLPDSFALRIAPGGMLVDQRTYTDPASLLLASEDPAETETVVREVVEAIHHARVDDRVQAIVLELDRLYGGGLSKMQEIGEALEYFKAAGKTVIAVGDNYTQDQYYLASYADRIYMNDMGSVLLTGYGRYGNYFKSALDKLDINFHIFRSGKYKDAVEPFLRDSMSDESRAHNQALVDQLWEIYTRDVETRRNLPRGAITGYINNMGQAMAQAGGDSALLSAQNGLVDELASRGTILRALMDELGESPEGDYYNAVGIRSYLTDINRFKVPSRDQIGLLVASGNIVDGYQPDGTIGSDTLLELLRGVRDNPDIKALVIRIDSGGGSAFASEVIRAEINAVRATGKPVYISMGSVAASGGYWLATAGDEIWATPATITGSIGVFGAFPTLEKSLSRLGIHTDGVGTTQLSGSLRIDRELSPEAAAILQSGVDHIYQRFVQLVATSRQASPEDIDRIAQGHIWSGITALELGLVDQLGNLNDVIAAAAGKAGLENYSVELITQPLSPRDILVRQLLGESASSWLPVSWKQSFAHLKKLQQFSPLNQTLQLLDTMNDPQSVYAACLDCAAP